MKVLNPRMIKDIYINVLKNNVKVEIVNNKLVMSERHLPGGWLGWWVYRDDNWVYHRTKDF